MKKKTYRLAILPTMAFTLLGCIGSTTLEAPKPEPAGANGSGIDYSSTSPDCETAAQRIADNVTEGMPMLEVRRLVGKPAYRLPGVWWWSTEFSRTGRPYVLYNAISADVAEAVVTEISIDTSNC